jgi:TonB family protein
MSAPRLGDEPAADRARTRTAMAVSVALHALLLLGLLFVRPAAPRAALTEIAWLEPGEAGGDEPAGAPLARRRAPAPAGALVTTALDERFRREASRGDFAPEPQSDLALDDRLSARLASLQGAAPTGVIVAGSVGVPSGILGAPAAPPGGRGGLGGTLGLNRGAQGGGGGGPGLALTRGGPGVGQGLVPAVPAAPKPPPAAPAAEGEATARRMVAGASLLGPVADRPILRHAVPGYPDWAKHDGVEAAVTLYFVVRADGTVRENVLVQKTAGFEDFDENARGALRSWRFEPLRGGRTGDQWGTITFHFRLRS